MRFTLPALMAAAGLTLTTLPAHALNILLVNDDGLTSNVIALHDALVAAGHDVVVSVPCSGQSGMGAAMYFLRPIGPLAEACLNNAAAAGAPGVGPVTKTGGDFSDYFYVAGTPVMATAYGLDVVAPARWNAAPDLVLSGPNEGQNVGLIVMSSGTVSNAEFAAGRGLPAIAVSAGSNTAGTRDADGNVALNPLSTVVADLTVEFVAHLAEMAGDTRLLPEHVALNVNFPNDVTPETTWAFAEIGTYNTLNVRFAPNFAEDPAAVGFGLGNLPLPGITIGGAPAEPTAEEMDDEAFVVNEQIAVTALQVAYDANEATQDWLRGALAGLPAR